MLHIFHECLLLFHPRAGVGLVLWGLKLNLGAVLFKKENKKILTYN